MVVLGWLEFHPGLDLLDFAEKAFSRGSATLSVKRGKEANPTYPSFASIPFHLEVQWLTQ